MSRRNRRAEFTPEPIETEPWRLEQQAREWREQSIEQFRDTLQRLGVEEWTALWNAEYGRRSQMERRIERTEFCQLPGCDKFTIRLAGRSLGICDLHAMPVVQWSAIVMDEHEQRMLKADVEARRLHRERRFDRAEERRREKARTEPGWIYYLLVGERIKIGYTVDVRRRLRAYPPDSPLLALHPGTKQTEHDMHVKFAGSKAAGREWFLDTPEIRAHIKQVIEQFGEPDRPRYEHRGQRAG
jgi:hypothetical protein